MSKLQGEILTLQKMSGSVSTPKSLSGNVGAKIINIGAKGDDGATFVPYVSDDGVISWTNDKELPNPEPVNIKGVKGDKGDKGDRGEQGIQGVRGLKGEAGEQGQKGEDGISATHSWNGTVLTMTSASGTSSADLKGEQGIPGPAGSDANVTSKNIESALGFTPADSVALSMKQDKPIIKTAMDEIAVAGAQYYLGEQTAVSVVLPDDAEAGQMVTVSWYNGATASTLSITGTMLAFDYTPSANTRSEINALWDGKYWAVIGNEMEAPAE